MASKWFKKNKGFNLISLLVVMLIIAVLVLLAVPKYQSNIKTANRTKLLHDGKVLQDACYLYNVDHEGSDKPWPISNEISVGDLPGFAVNLKGEEVALASSDNYYSIDMEALKPYISKLSSDLSHYVLKLPVGDVIVTGVESNSSEIIKHRDSESDEIEIWTAEQLMSICYEDNAEYPADGKFIQMADIDLSGYADWVPIGGTMGPPFCGVYDGNGYIIKDFCISDSIGSNFGLFGIVVGAELCNINLKNVSSITEDAGYTGSLVSQGINVTVRNCYGEGNVNGFDKSTGGLLGFASNANVENCSFKGSVEGAEEVGGLVGESYSSVYSYCFSEGSVLSFGKSSGGLFGRLQNCDINSCNSSCSVEVHCSTSDAVYAGGLVGDLYGSGVCNGSYSTGDILMGNESTANIVGGLFGKTQGDIVNCYATGNISGDGSYAGGLAGECSGDKVESSYAKGDIEGEFMEMGGLIGFCQANSVEFCYAEGKVTNNETAGGIYAGGTGGLLGYGDSLVLSCYATGDVVSKYNPAGGLVGWTYGNIEASYATGDVEGEDSVGGLVGVVMSGCTKQSYSTGKVVGNDMVGGLVGAVYSNVETSYATGDVEGVSSVGGLVGYISCGGILQSYSVGRVIGDDDVGGFIGLSYIDHGVDGCYWDTTRSELYQGVGCGDNGGVSGKSTMEMKKQATFEDWDFAGLWLIEEDITYPYFNR